MKIYISPSFIELGVDECHNLTNLPLSLPENRPSTVLNPYIPRHTDTLQTWISEEFECHVME